jgi:hypothetical protein
MPHAARTRTHEQPKNVAQYAAQYAARPSRPELLPRTHAEGAFLKSFQERVDPTNAVLKYTYPYCGCSIASVGYTCAGSKIYAL